MYACVCPYESEQMHYFLPPADSSALMAQALLMGNFEAAVEMCLAEDKMAEAILLAIAGGPELLLRTQKKYFQRNKSNIGRVSGCIAQWFVLSRSVLLTHGGICKGKAVCILLLLSQLKRF